MSNSPIQYTSKTFNTILNDINSDSELVDKPDWWKRIWAGVGDVFAMWNNATANQSFLRTAFTRQAVTDLLRLIDYELTSQIEANGNTIFYLSSGVIFPKIISITDIVASTQGNINQSSKRFEGRSSITVNQIQETFLPAAVNIANDTITLTREYVTGEKIHLSGADLPAPLIAATDYYVIRDTTTEIKLSTTLENAYSGTQIDITTQGTGVHTIDLYSFITTTYQQTTKPSTIVGTSDGVTTFQEYNTPDIDVLINTIQVTINAQQWTRVDTFIDSTSTDKHFRLLYNTDNSSFIQFGDGNFGKIPEAFDININYAIGGGAESNISENKLTVYAGNDSDIVGVSNPTALTGGANPQAIEEGKRLGPILLKSRDRFVTAADGAALALAFGGLSQTKVNSNAFGVLSAQVLGVANGGGNPSTQLKADLQLYLIDRTILESIDVRVQDLTITAVNATSAAKILPGYSYTNVEPFYRLAWELLLTEAGVEIQQEFLENGISSTITLINVILGESFTIDDADQISILVVNMEPRLIGNDIQESDALGYIDAYVNGIDYLTISAPIFPVVIGDNEISTVGTLSLLEIP